VDLPLLVACKNALAGGGPTLAPLPTEVAMGGLSGLGIAVLLVVLRGREMHPSDQLPLLVLGGCVGMLVGAPLS
jgi:hypothetical protein